ncbi:MAG: hypothetical protein R3C03_08380 [Pirellulaceae bacterium]
MRRPRVMYSAAGNMEYVVEEIQGKPRLNFNSQKSTYDDLIELKNSLSQQALQNVLELEAEQLQAMSAIWDKIPSFQEQTNLELAEKYGVRVETEKMR